MEEISNLFHGFAVVLQPFNLFVMVLGIMLGVMIGVLLALSTTAARAGHSPAAYPATARFPEP